MLKFFLLLSQFWAVNLFLNPPVDLLLSSFKVVHRVPHPEVHPAVLIEGTWVGSYTDIDRVKCDLTLYTRVKEKVVNGSFSITLHNLTHSINAPVSPEISYDNITDSGEVTGRTDGDRVLLYLRRNDSKNIMLCLNGYCKSIAKNYRLTLDDGQQVDTIRYIYAFYGSAERPVIDSLDYDYNAGSFIVWNNRSKFGE
jgi:hypothetical protein